ncbi:MAG TPA: hypothetical protein VMV33_06170 [Rhodocyclaceae bacterium]|nr:hypothetical protein [Rhodocyclaceae bacterium]
MSLAPRTMSSIAQQEDQAMSQDFLTRQRRDFSHDPDPLIFRLIVFFYLLFTLFVPGAGYRL